MIGQSSEESVSLGPDARRTGTLWLIFNLATALVSRISERILLYSDVDTQFWSMKLLFAISAFVLVLTLVKARIGWIGKTFASFVCIVGQWKALQTGFAFATWTISGFAP